MNMTMWTLEDHDPSHHRYQHSEIVYVPGQDENLNLVNYALTLLATPAIEPTDATTIIRADVNVAPPELALNYIGRCPNLKQLDCKHSHLDFDHDELVGYDEHPRFRRTFLQALAGNPHLPMSNLQVLKLDMHYVAIHSMEIVQLLERPGLKLKRLGLSFDFRYIPGDATPGPRAISSLALAVVNHGTGSITALELGVPNDNEDSCFESFWEQLVENAKLKPFILNHLVLLGDNDGLTPFGIERLLMRIPYAGAFACLQTLELQHFEFSPRDVTCICQFLNGFLQKPPVLSLFFNNFVLGGNKGERREEAKAIAFNRIKLAYDRAPGIAFDDGGDDIEHPRLEGFALNVAGPAKHPVVVFWNRPFCANHEERSLVWLDNLADLMSPLIDVNAIESVREGLIVTTYALEILRNNPHIVEGGIQP